MVRISDVQSERFTLYVDEAPDRDGNHTTTEPLAGQAPRKPAPLFKKLDESLNEEEYARLKGQ